MTLEGLRLGQYRLLQLLGSGGMGEVYLAEDARINQQVAIKVNRTEATIYRNSDITRDAVGLFQGEARAIARLDHPHILPLFSYGEESVNGTRLIYTVMPYRHGGLTALAVILCQRPPGVDGRIEVFSDRPDIVCARYARNALKRIQVCPNIGTGHYHPACAIPVFRQRVFRGLAVVIVAHRPDVVR